MDPRAVLKRGYLALSPLLLKRQRLLRAIVRNRLMVVLNFHQISPITSPYADPIDPLAFDELVGFVRRVFNVRTFGDLGQATSDPRPVAVLSFDDGYQDFLEYAMPILERHGVRVNQNIVPSAAFGRRPFTVELADLVVAAPVEVLRRLTVPGATLAVGDGGPLARMRYRVALSRALKLRPLAERAALWSALEPELRSVEVRTPTRMMDVAGVRQAAAVHEVGAHSYDHETMSVEPMEYFAADFERCERFFAEELDQVLRIYAFPNGLARPEQVAWLRARGVEHVLLTGDRYSRAEARVHHRFNMAGSDRRELRLQALGLRAGGLL